jgi:hypothetical protein
MAEFRFDNRRRPGEGLDPADEARIRRYIQEENDKIGKINKKLTPNKQLFPIDEDVMVYSIATGEAAKRKLLLDRLKEIYPAPPIENSGFPVATSSVIQTPAGNVTAQDISQAPTPIEEKQNATVPPWNQEQQDVARIAVNQLQTIPGTKFDEFITRATESIEEIDRISDGVKTYKDGVQVVDNVSPASVTPGAAADTPTGFSPIDPNVESVQNQLTRLGSTSTVPVGPSLEEVQRRANEKPQTAGEFKVDISGYTLPVTNNKSETVIDTSGPRPNPLREFATYTYNLSLRALSIRDFNDIASDPESVREKTKNVLINSGGIRNEELVRVPEFNEDFFFDKLTVNTVMGLNARGRGSNIIEMNFTIIEPHGITLINRLLKVAKRLDIKRWDEMPFLMVIDFYGNTDSGRSIRLSSQTKYLPIKIIDVKIKLTFQGSEYQITAVPYSHQAFTETMGTTPINLEVTAKTIDGFFDNNGTSGDVGKVFALQSELDKREETINEQSKLDPGTIGRAMRDGAVREKAKLQNEVGKLYYKVGSYSAAIDKYQNLLLEKKSVEHADRYFFSFDEEISKAKLTDKLRNNVRSSPMSNNNNSESTILNGIKARLGIENTVVSTEQMVFPINAGTNIIEVINQAVRNSSYITDQIKETTENKKPELDKPVKWYKIFPSVTLGNYDSRRGVYQKTIRYTVKKYFYYNTKYPYADKSNPSTWAKEYDYIFTGKNESVIDVNIDFNTAFFIAIQSLGGKSLEASGPLTKSRPEDVPDWDVLPDPIPTTTADSSTDASKLKTYPHSGTDEAKTNYDKTSDKTLDMFKSVMSSARGDMVNIQLKILGDPEFIKQDDLLYVPYEQTSTRFIDNFGSLVTDAGEIFVFLRFRTPSDINQSSGLMDFTTWESESTFNGLYRVITVNSEFSRGQFIQTLDLIRQFDQEDLLANRSMQPAEDSSRETAEDTPIPQEKSLVANTNNSIQNNNDSDIGDGPAGYKTSKSMPSSAEIAADTVLEEPKASGDKVKIPGPRRIPAETALDEATPTEKIKQGIEDLKNKISNLPTTIADAENKLNRTIFAPDPNAPPYTGNDPFIRRRLGLPEVDLGPPSPATARLTNDQVNQQINNIIRGQ